MARSRTNKKGRTNSGRFAGIPHTVMDHDDYQGLRGSAVKLLMELVRQYNGHNNGDLSAGWGLMKRRGFRSKATLDKARNELLEKRLIVITRHGRFMNPGGACSLYALTWQPIDECPGKQLERQPTTTPPRKFSLERFRKPGTETVPSGDGKWGDITPSVH